VSRRYTEESIIEDVCKVGGRKIRSDKRRGFGPSLFFLLEAPQFLSYVYLLFSKKFEVKVNSRMSSPVPSPALDAETKFPSILAILIVGCVLSTTVVTLRLITRLAIIHTFGLDDFMIGVAQVGTLENGHC
jgi:hypothetical protein